MGEQKDLPSVVIETVWLSSVTPRKLSGASFRGPGIGMSYSVTLLRRILTGSVLNGKVVEERIDPW